MGESGRPKGPERKVVPLGGDVPPWLHACEGGVLVDLLVVPRASRNRIVGEHDRRLKVQLAAPPVEGRANAAAVDLLAKTLKVPRVQVQVVAGHTSRRKTIRLNGVDLQRAKVFLTPRKG